MHIHLWLQGGFFFEETVTVTIDKICGCVRLFKRDVERETEREGKGGPNREKKRTITNMFPH